MRTRSRAFVLLVCIVVLGQSRAQSRPSEEPPASEGQSQATAGLEAEGRATIVNADFVRARARALEEAMRNAVVQAAQAQLGADQETIKPGSDIDVRLHSSVYPQLREYITRYRILTESTTPTEVRIRIAADVASERLQRALRPEPTAGRPTPLQLCIRAADEVSPLVRDQLLARLRDQGFAPTVLPTPCAQGTPAAPDPITHFLSATVETQPDGTIRGAGWPIAHAVAMLRFVGKNRSLLIEERATAQRYAQAPADAANQAATAVLEQALGRIATRLTAHTITTPGELRVHIAEVPDYRRLNAVMQRLLALPGSSAVVPRRVSAAGVELLVRTSASATQLCAALQTAPQPPGEDTPHLTARPTSPRSVEVTLEPASPPDPAPSPGQ